MENLWKEETVFYKKNLKQSRQKEKTKKSDQRLNRMKFSTELDKLQEKHPKENSLEYISDYLKKNQATTSLEKQKDLEVSSFNSGNKLDKKSKQSLDQNKGNPDSLSLENDLLDDNELETINPHIQSIGRKKLVERSRNQSKPLKSRSVLPSKNKIYFKTDQKKQTPSQKNLFKSSFVKKRKSKNQKSSETKKQVQFDLRKRSKNEYQYSSHANNSKVNHNHINSHQDHFVSKINESLRQRRKSKKRQFHKMKLRKNDSENKNFGNLVKIKHPSKKVFSVRHVTFNRNDQTKVGSDHSKEQCSNTCEPQVDIKINGTSVRRFLNSKSNTGFETFSKGILGWF